MFELFKFFIAEEWKGKHAIMGSFLYIFSAVLITYLGIGAMDASHYAAVFWILVIFTTLQGISRSFIQMRSSNYLFWHQIARPEQYLLARLLSSSVLMLIFLGFTLCLFALMHGWPEMDVWAFIINMSLTGLCISAIFTISSSISSKTNQAGILLPVLTFPVILPVILIGMKTGNLIIQGQRCIDLIDDFAIESGLLILSWVMGRVLFSFIWKD